VKLLKEVANQFGVSKAVFKAAFEEGNTHIEFELKEQYRPQPGHFDDPIAKLLASKYQETFDKTLKRFVHNFSFENIYKDIMKDITLFYIEHTDLKNPKQSRLYKWLDLSYTNQMKHPASEGFIALYRYIHGNGGIGRNNMTVENVLAILELMREKYEVKQEAD
jgi:hypothetical protein